MEINFKIRNETPADYGEVENLTREAFWNVYRPGCNEHYVLHGFRSRTDFVPELDTVIEKNGVIVAHIMYCRAQIETEDGGIPVMMFGPVSVLPEYQGQGLGSEIIRYTLEKAAALGCGAVAITGNPLYYHRFGFVSGSSLGVRYAPAPEDDEAEYFMIKELVPGFLGGIKGTFEEPDGYAPPPDETERFDAHFPPKEKKRLPGQFPD